MSTGPITGYPLANWNSIQGWNFNAILSEFRSICGIPDASMYSDAQCATLINYYYQYVLPKELKIFWGYTYYQFYTQPNIDQYPSTGPTNNTTIDFQTFNPQVWVDGWPVEWYISPDLFYQDWPQQENKLVIGSGDGTTLTFPFAFPDFPILPGSVYVTDGTQVATDNGTGGFLAPNSGTINYSSGTGDVTFAVAPVANSTITATSFTYMANRPQAILYFKSGPLADATQLSRDTQNYFVLRPVPDQVYLMKMQGIQIPKPLINYTDVPYRPDLGPLIALGAALHRFKLFNQMDQYDQYMPEYMRFKDVCMQDTYEELLYQRAVPAF